MLLSLGGRSVAQRPCRYGWRAGTSRRPIRAPGGRVGCRHDTLRKLGKPTTSHDDTTRARREQSNRTVTVACGRDVKPRDRRNPAQPSAKHDIPKASTWSPSWSLSWYRSSSLSSSSERTPESRRKVHEHVPGVKYETFRDLILARMKAAGYRPPGMAQVLDQIVADRFP